MGRQKLKPDKSIAAAFSWLVDLGFETTKVDWGGQFVTFSKDDVDVTAEYHWHDGNAVIAIARKRHGQGGRQPYWTNVHLREILAKRAPGVAWNNVPPDDDDLDGVFRSGSALLRTHASDLVGGQNLEELDEIIKSRPRRGIPGLDFPATQPWFSSMEGMWTTTDNESPQPMHVYLDRSNAVDPETRAVAALKMIVATRLASKTEIEAAHMRLHELLRDDVDDVRRAAGSALGVWGDVDALDELLDLLATESQETPFAAAATFVVLRGSKVDQERVGHALAQFAAKSPAAAEQVEQLAWRLGGGGSPQDRLYSS